MDSKTIEPSPVIMDLLKRLKPASNLYEMSANAAELWGGMVKKEKTKFSIQLRGNNKGKMRGKH